MKKRIKIILTIVLAFVLFMPNVHAASNLFDGTEPWTAFFDNSWFQSAGSITSSSSEGFVLDATSIGVYQWPSSDYGFGVQASIKNKSITLKAGKEYTFTAKIKSDKDRKIFFKLVNVIDGVDDGDEMIAEWITLTAGEEYTFTKKFTPVADTDRISVYYAIGYSGQDSAEPNSANKIEVNDVMITREFILDNYKAEKINEVSNYENPNNSEAINNIIEEAKTNINNATTEGEVDEAYMNFLVQLNIQQALENNNNQNNNPTENINNTNQSTTNNTNTPVNNSNNKVSTTDTNNTINNNPITKDNIIMYFITLIIGLVGFELIGRKIVLKKH